MKCDKCKTESHKLSGSKETGYKSWCSDCFKPKKIEYSDARKLEIHERVKNIDNFQKTNNVDV